MEIKELPINQIRPNLNQPRKFVDESGLRELANSIKTKGLPQRLSKIQKSILVDLLSRKKYKIGWFVYPAYTRRYEELKEMVAERLGKWTIFRRSAVGDYLTVDECFTSSFSRSIRNLYKKGLVIYNEKLPGGNIKKIQLTKAGVAKALKVDTRLLNIKRKVKVIDCSHDFKRYFLSMEKLKGTKVIRHRTIHTTYKDKTMMTL